MGDTSLRLEQRAHRRVDWFYAVEAGSGGWVHLHALTSGTAGLWPAALHAAWPHGWTRVTRFDPGRGAAHYVTKNIAHEMVEYDISPKLTEQRDVGMAAGGGRYETPRA